MQGLGFRLDFMHDVIWQCMNMLDKEKDIDLRTTRFIDSCIGDMSVHQVNDLVKKNLDMNFLNYAKCIVEKFDVKSLKFTNIFKEWASDLVMNKFKFLAPWEILQPIMMSINGKNSNADKAMHDYIEMVISSNIEIDHFLKLSEALFKYCCVKSHLMVLGYIVTKLEWSHFQEYLEKLDDAKVLNCRIFKTVINALCYSGKYDQMKFVLNILFRNEELFMNLELSQNQYKFIVICLFQIISEGKLAGEQGIPDKTKSVCDKYLTVFQSNLENKSMKGIKNDAVSWMMMDEF